MSLDRLKDIKLLRKLIYAVIGPITYPGLAMVNKMQITGTEHLKMLPKRNVLFVSNHQTYFADVMAFLHIFCAVKWGKKNRLGVPFYFLNPFVDVNFVAAEETMKDNLLTRIFTLAGAITIKRTWRAAGKDVKREVDFKDSNKIHEALGKRWVITFPQGTTKPFAPGRKGTAHIIKDMKPIVVPVVINGFWRAFNRKGLRFKKRGTTLSVSFKPPMEINYDASVEEILEQVMDAIEQSSKFMSKSSTAQNIAQVNH
jgi:1-acyl-sn-glycerol-3-phosphate acyltransferase